MAGIELARMDCSTEPSRTIEVLDVVRQLPISTGCQRVLLLPPAACARAASSDDQPPWLAELATLPEDAVSRCGASVVAGVLGEAGFWYFAAGDWDRAAEVLGRAYTVSGEVRAMVGYGEALLMAGRAAEVEQTIDMSRIAGADQRTHSAYLLWAAAGSEVAARRLLTEYDALPDGTPAVADAAHNLEEQACIHRGSRACRVFELLVAPKRAGAVDTLERRLLATR